MAQAETPRVNPDAVTAVRALLGCTDEVAIDVIEVLRPHLELPLRVALIAAQNEVLALRQQR